MRNLILKTALVAALASSGVAFAGSPGHTSRAALADARARIDATNANLVLYQKATTGAITANVAADDAYRGDCASWLDGEFGWEGVGLGGLVAHKIGAGEIADVTDAIKWLRDLGVCTLGIAEIQQMVQGETDFWQQQEIDSNASAIAAHADASAIQLAELTQRVDANGLAIKANADAIDSFLSGMSVTAGGSAGFIPYANDAVAGGFLPLFTAGLGTRMGTEAGYTTIDLEAGLGADVLQGAVMLGYQRCIEWNRCGGLRARYAHVAYGAFSAGELASLDVFGARGNYMFQVGPDRRFFVDLSADLGVARSLDKSGVVIPAVAQEPVTSTTPTWGVAASGLVQIRWFFDNPKSTTALATKPAAP
jgi:hypothetical protein